MTKLRVSKRKYKSKKNIRKYRKISKKQKGGNNINNWKKTTNFGPEPESEPESEPEPVAEVVTGAESEPVPGAELDPYNSNSEEEEPEPEPVAEVVLGAETEEAAEAETKVAPEGAAAISTGLRRNKRRGFKGRPTRNRSRLENGSGNNINLRKLANDARALKLENAPEAAALAPAKGNFSQIIKSIYDSQATGSELKKYNKKTLNAIYEFFAKQIEHIAKLDNIKTQMDEETDEKLKTFLELLYKSFNDISTLFTGLGISNQESVYSLENIEVDKDTLESTFKYDQITDTLLLDQIDYLKQLNSKLQIIGAKENDVIKSITDVQIEYEKSIASGNLLSKKYNKPGTKRNLNSLFSQPFQLFIRYKDLLLAIENGITKGIGKGEGDRETLEALKGGEEDNSSTIGVAKLSKKMKEMVDKLNTEMGKVEDDFKKEQKEIKIRDTYGLPNNINLVNLYTHLFNKLNKLNNSNKNLTKKKGILNSIIKNLLSGNEAHKKFRTIKTKELINKLTKKNFNSILSNSIFMRRSKKKVINSLRTELNRLVEEEKKIRKAEAEAIEQVKALEAKAQAKAQAQAQALQGVGSGTLAVDAAAAAVNRRPLIPSRAAPPPPSSNKKPPLPPKPRLSPKPSGLSNKGKKALNQIEKELAKKRGNSTA